MLCFCFKLVILIAVCRISLTFKDDDAFDTDDDDSINRFVKIFISTYPISLIITLIYNSYTEGNFLLDLTVDFTESTNMYFSNSYIVAKVELKSFCDQWASTVGEEEVPDTTNKIDTWEEAGGVTSWVDSTFTPTEIKQIYS